MNAKGMRPSAVEITCNYQKRYDIQTSDANAIFIGLAETGVASSAASWQIKKITLVSDVPTQAQWADGDQAFDNVWDDRTSLSYS